MLFETHRASSGSVMHIWPKLAKDHGKIGIVIQSHVASRSVIYLCCHFTHIHDYLYIKIVHTVTLTLL